LEFNIFQNSILDSRARYFCRETETPTKRPTFTIVDRLAFGGLEARSRFESALWRASTGLVFKKEQKEKRHMEDGEGDEGGREEETKTIDTTRRQGQSGRVLFAEWPIKMPTASPAGPLIRRHVNQS